MIFKDYINKFNILFSFLFMLLITFKNVYEDYLIHDNKNFRVLIFASCDELYSHYIPIFCHTILKTDELKRIDIEIHLGNQRLTQNEEKAIDFIRKKYYYPISLFNFLLIILNQIYLGSPLFYNEYFEFF